MTGPSNSPQPPDGAATSVAVDSSRARSPSRDENAEREEGIELAEIQTQEDDWEARSSVSLSSGETYRFTTRTRSRTSQRTASIMEAKGIWGSVRRFWNGHVVLTVPEKHNRDHFGKLAHRSSAAHAWSASTSRMPRKQPQTRDTTTAYRRSYANATQHWSEHSSHTFAPLLRLQYWAYLSPSFSVSSASQRRTGTPS